MEQLVSYRTGIKSSGCGKPTMSGGSIPPPPTTWAVAKCMLVYQTKGFLLPVRVARNLGEGLPPASPGKEAGVFDFVLQSFHCLIFLRFDSSFPTNVADLRIADKLAKRKDA